VIWGIAMLRITGAKRGNETAAVVDRNAQRLRLSRFRGDQYTYVVAINNTITCEDDACMVWEMVLKNK